jgi:membrane protein implicated in regulation of membrane protease activity
VIWAVVILSVALAAAVAVAAWALTRRRDLLERRRALDAEIERIHDRAEGERARVTERADEARDRIGSLR